MNSKIKLVFSIVLVFVGGCSLLTLGNEKSLLTNAFKGLFARPNNGLPTDIYSNRNCLKIDNASFVNNNGQMYVEVQEDLYPVEGYMLNYSLIEIEQVDSLKRYNFHPEYYKELFSHKFQAIDVTFSSDYPDLDRTIYPNGIYVHESLSPLFTYKEEKKHYCEKYPLFMRVFLWFNQIRTNYDVIFTKSSQSLLSTYKTGVRIYYYNPLLYIPYPASNIGYLFSADVLKNFNEIAPYVQDQNFYATLAYIPDNIERLGTIISANENGMLVNLNRDKTGNLRLHLVKLNNGERYYAAVVNYKRQWIFTNNSLMKDSLVLHNISTSMMYDKVTFENLRKILSELNYEVFL